MDAESARVSYNCWNFDLITLRYLTSKSNAPQVLDNPNPKMTNSSSASNLASQNGRKSTSPIPRGFFFNYMILIFWIFRSFTNSTLLIVAQIAPCLVFSCRSVAWSTNIWLTIFPILPFNNVSLGMPVFNKYFLIILAGFTYVNCGSIPPHLDNAFPTFLNKFVPNEKIFNEHW